MADRSEVERARDGVADTLRSIESGELETLPEGRAFLQGSLAALDAVLSGGEARADGTGSARPD
jgi:hypothetical protein